MHDNFAKHGGASEQICPTGHSAGAQLVALLGTDAKRLEEAGKSLKALRAVFPFDSAAMDLREIAKNDRRTDLGMSGAGLARGCSLDGGNNDLRGAYSSGLQALPRAP